MARPRTRPSDSQELTKYKREYARLYYHKYKLRPGYKHSIATPEQLAQKAIHTRQYLADLRANSPDYAAKKKAHDKRYRSTEAGRLTIHRSRAKRRAAEGKHAINRHDWARTLAAFMDLCAYCQNAAPTTKDHFVPLCLGGGTVVGNLVPACNHCNFSKNGKPPDVWCSEEQFLRVRSTLDLVLNAVCVIPRLPRVL